MSNCAMGRSYIRVPLVHYQNQNNSNTYLLSFVVTDKIFNFIAESYHYVYWWADGSLYEEVQQLESYGLLPLLNELVYNDGRSLFYRGDFKRLVELAFNDPVVRMMLLVLADFDCDWWAEKL